MASLRTDIRPEETPIEYIPSMDTESKATGYDPTPSWARGKEVESIPTVDTRQKLPQQSPEVEALVEELNRGVQYKEGTAMSEGGETPVLGSEFGLKGLNAKRYTVDGNAMGNTPEEAIAEYNRMKLDKEAFTERKNSFEEASELIKSGDYTESDIKKLTKSGKTTVTNSEGISILRRLGLTEKDASSIVRSTGDIYTSSGGAVISGLKDIIENARRKGFLPKLSPVNAGELSQMKRDRGYSDALTDKVSRMKRKGE